MKNGIKMFSSLGLDPAGPRWFDGLLWDSWSELRKNTIRYLFSCFFVVVVLGPNCEKPFAGSFVTFFKKIVIFQILSCQDCR